MYRDDYHQLGWYARVDAFVDSQTVRYLALPYSLRYAWGNLQESRGRTIPRKRPRPDWVAYGAEPRSSHAFRTNLAVILDLAELRGDPLVLMTFAYYVAPGYSLAQFQARALDYADHVSAIEIWGDPQHVARSIGLHNAVVEELATTHPEVAFVPQEQRIADSARYFNDICHLTDEGGHAFVTHIVETLDARNYW